MTTPCVLGNISLLVVSRVNSFGRRSSQARDKHEGGALTTLYGRKRCTSAIVRGDQILMA
jgi:hypothetical protein